jgi:manganese-dependent ADP-ribose/CDP-alcohol diphosphatase
VLGVWRYYNQSLSMLAAAASHFRGTTTLVVHLGDLVDGKAASGVAGASALMDAAQQALSQAGRVHYLLGNHELYVASRAALLQRYGIVPAEVGHRGDDHSYYSVSVPGAGVRLVFVDSYDVALIGRPASDARVIAAKEQLLAHNPAYNASGGTSSGNDPSGLRGLARSWVALNGGVGHQQLAWLKAQLAEARGQGQRVLVFSHIALHPRAQSARCAGMCVVWDFEEVMAVLRPYGDTIAACFAGHDHSGGYARDSGIHFVTVEGIIESRWGGEAFAEVALYSNKLVVRGHGRVTSRHLRLKALPVRA